MKRILTAFLALCSLAALAQAPSSTITFPTLNKIKIVDRDGSSQILSGTATTYRFVAWNQSLEIKEYGTVVFRAPISEVKIDTAVTTPGKIVLLDLKLAIPSTSSGGGGGSGAALPAGGTASNYLRGDNTFSGLNASHVSAGTLSDARLSGNVALRSGSENVYTNVNRFNSYFRASAALSAASGSVQAVMINPTLTATANGDQLTALDINPTFNPGSFTGVNVTALRVGGGASVTGFSSFGGGLSTSGVYSNTYQGNGSNLTFRSSSGTTAFGVYNGTANVQIGNLTTDNGNLLQVGGSASFAGDLVFDNATRTMGSNSARLGKLWANETDINNNYSNRGFLNFIRSRGTHLSYENASGTLVARLFENGNLNLGSTATDPTVKLNAEGTIKATEFNSTNGLITMGGQTINTSGATTTMSGNVVVTGNLASNSLIRASGSLIVGSSNSGDIDPSAAIHVASTTKGFLPPRMTSAQRTSISSPATGLLVYQTDGTEGLYVKQGSSWAPVAGSGSGGGQTSPVPYTIVSNVSELRSAITNAANYTTIYLMPGNYPLASPLEIQGKTGLIIDGGGRSATITASSITENLVIRGNVTDVTIRGIRFTNTNTLTGGYGMILVNEQGPVTNLAIEDCFFSNGSTKQNAITMTANSGNTTAVYKRITVRNCSFVDIGRMGIEILNHAWDRPGTAPQTYSKNITIKNNYFENLGINDLEHGMAVSVSGLNELVDISENKTIEGKFACYELVGGRQADISNNFASGVTNSAVGISISNGNGKGASERVTMKGNNFMMIGRAFQVYDATWVTMTGNIFFSNLLNDIRSNLVVMNSNEIKVLNDMNALYMEHAKYCLVKDNIMSTTGASVQTYGVINAFYNAGNTSDSRNSTDNDISGNKLFRPGNAAQSVIEGSTTLNVIKDNTPNP